MRRSAVRLFVLVILASAAIHAQSLSRQDAVRFEAKLATIQKNALVPAKGKSARTTQVSDNEVNAYLKFLAGSQVPVGIVDPLLHAAGNGVVTGRATVDLDAVRTQKKRGWMDPLAYLMGKLPVTAAGTLTTKDGVGKFELKSAEISGVTVPKSLVQELLSYYSRTPETPAGINMDDPFTLPAAIREIKVGKGSATIVQ